MADVNFAYRFHEAIAMDLRHSQWREHNHEDPPKPPERWQPGGFARDWHEWRNGNPVREGNLDLRDTYSVVWSQLYQTYWVVPWDCTKRLTQRHEWLSLHCHKLADDSTTLTGLWKLIEVGDRLQHESSCPGTGFEQFLPRNFFNGKRPDAPCHFVGKLTLILALMAMVPRRPDRIHVQIENGFYFSPSEGPMARFERSIFSPTDDPMDRFVPPGRGIVMETASIRGRPNSTKPHLESWENGYWGPMVSSHPPERNDWRRWLAWQIQR